MKTTKTNHQYKRIAFVLALLLTSTNSFSQVWTPLTTNITNNLKACFFLDANTGWVAGDSGTVIKTTDGGNTWSMRQNTGTINPLRSIYFINSTTGWAGGNSGELIKTTDGGNTWDSLYSNTTQQINCVKFADANTGWLVANGGTIRYSSNGGTTWGPQLSGIGGSNIWGLSVGNTLNAFCSGSSHKGSKTTNGTNWVGLDFAGGPLVQYNDVYFTDLNNGWTVNTVGGIYKTTNGGATTPDWDSLTSPTTNDLLSIDMLNTMSGWISGRQGTILSTTNGGTLWNAEASGTTSALWQIDFVNDTTGWAVYDNGGVIKYQHIIPTAPLTLLQPNGGEIYNIGTTQNIIWLANGVTCVTIQYSTNNGANWINIPGATNITTPPNSFPWTIPNTPSLQALVRIVDCSNSANADTSTSIFYIQPIAQGEDYSVLVTATSSNAPAQITLNWVPDPNALTYTVDRKLKTDIAWTFLANVSVAANTYVDNTVNVGEAWEYRITKTTPQLTGYGYIYAGLELAETDFRGTALLLIDTNFYNAIASEIDQMELDLIGDGYSVVKNIVDPIIGVQAIRNIITQEYINGDSALTTVISIGHLPAAYSGNFAPDGHAERVGAQPTDGFYGDIDGVWTDSYVTVVNTGVIFSPNIPADGNFDTDTFPSAIELQVGRIDMHNMTGFSLSEGNLLKQYLNRDHDFKLKVFDPGYRALMNTTMDHTLPTTSAGAWRSFSPMFGNSIKEMNTNYAGITEFMDSLTNQSYMWTHMAGGGSDTSMSTDVFTSTGCINNPINTVFMQMYGSYFVEWYKGSSYFTNNLLRAPMASNGTTLATMWSGKAPYWHMHHMALGETIGYSTVTNQNNYSTYVAGTNSLRHGIHMSLMGDPTLKMHIVAPISNLNATVGSGGVTVDLNWTASTDSNIVGYNIYRADNIYGSFVKLNTIHITSTSYMDLTPLAGNSVYMVRAVKLENRSSASYYNLSTGIIDSVFTTLGDPSILDENFTIYPNPTTDVLNFSMELERVEVYNVYGQLVLTNILNAKSISVENLANGIYFIRSGNINKKFIVKH